MCSGGHRHPTGDFFCRRDSEGVKRWLGVTGKGNKTRLVPATDELIAGDRTRGPEWAAQADVLASASAHWLHHTACSHITDRQVDMRYVRDNFGHSSISTTSGYLHSEDDARHQGTQERHRIGWGAHKEEGP